jgi:hypothetical protein
MSSPDGLVTKTNDQVPDKKQTSLGLYVTSRQAYEMLSHGYIKNDFDVREWAAPEFFEQAAKELLEDEWKKRSIDKLPEAVSLEDAMQMRLG